MKKVCIIGASGLVGRALSKKLRTINYQVLETSVRHDSDPDPSWESKLADSDTVVNLAGEPIFGKRWTDQVKSEIIDSRVLGTRKVVTALRRIHNQNPQKKITFVCASAIGFYGNRGDEVLNETSDPGSDFLAHLVREWEFEALAAQRVAAIPTAVIRTGIVLSKEAGALNKMLPAFRMGVGGPINCGNQWMSWIHIQDLVGIFVECISKELTGIYNAVSPAPVKNKEFSKGLGHVLGRPAFLPVPGIMLHIVFGESAQVLTSGQRVSADKILETGFTFQHPHLEEALRSLLKN